MYFLPSSKIFLIVGLFLDFENSKSSSMKMLFCCVEIGKNHSVTFSISLYLLFFTILWWKALHIQKIRCRVRKIVFSKKSINCKSIVPTCSTFCALVDLFTSLFNFKCFVSVFVSFVPNAWNGTFVSFSVWIVMIDE